MEPMFALGIAFKNPNIRWHYDHCAYSYDPKTETPDMGRLRQAAKLAAAEAWLRDLTCERLIDWAYETDPWDADDECPVPDEVRWLFVELRLPPRTRLRADDSMLGIVRIYEGPADGRPHIATFFSAPERAADYVRQANAPRVFRYSLGMIGMMHATQRDDMRMYEAEAALTLFEEWEAS